MITDNKFDAMQAWTQRHCWLFALPGSTPVRRRSSARPAEWGFRRRRGLTRTRGPSIQTDPERWAKTITTNWEPWWYLINYTVLYTKEPIIIIPFSKDTFEISFRKFPAKCAGTWLAGGTCGSTSRTTRDPPSHSAPFAARSFPRLPAGMLESLFLYFKTIYIN